MFLKGPQRKPGGSKGRTGPLWPVVILFLVVLAGCTRPSVTEEKEFRQKPLIWPPPPEPARIVYEKSISSPEDIGVKKGIFKKLLEFVIGAEKNAIIKPYGVNVDISGRLLVADTPLKRVHIYDLKKKKYTYIDRAGKNMNFESVIGVATDGEGNIYVTDSMAKRVFVYNNKGKFLFSFEAGERPTGIAINRTAGRVYVVDTGAHKVRIYDLRGRALSGFGSRGSENGQFIHPVDIFVDRNGEVYVTDTMNYRIQIFDEDGNFIARFGRHGDGTGDFGRPKGVAVDSEGNVYVVDALFDTVQIFSKDGTFLLNFGSIGSGHGKFWLPTGLFIDNSDNIYVADSYNKRVQIFEYVGAGKRGF